MQEDTGLERLLPSSSDDTSFLLFSTNSLPLQLLSLHLPQMILQNDTVWLGGDGIGESLIPNQGPVSAGRACIFLPPACWSLGTGREAHFPEDWPGKPCLSLSWIVLQDAGAQGELQGNLTPVAS